MLGFTRRCSIRLGIATASVALLLMRIAPLSAASANAPAKTPEQLIGNLLAAAHSGDTDGFLSLLAANSRDALTQSIANQAPARHAYETFLQALDSRFGQGTTMLSEPPDDLKTALSRLVEAQVLSQKPGEHGEVELRVKTTIKTPSGKTAMREETLLALQEAGGWKLVVGFPNDGALAAAEIAAAERITQEVRDGKYPDRQAAMIALADAWAEKERK